MTVQNHSESFARNLFSGQIIQMTHYVAQSRHLGDRHDVKLVTVTNHLKVLIAQPRSHIHKDKVVTHAQEVKRLRNGARENAPWRVVALGCRYQFKPA